MSIDQAHDDEYVAPAEEDVRQTLRSWRDLKFGALMHFAPGSQMGQTESWNLCGEDKDWIRRDGPNGGDYAAYKAGYEQLPRTFDPSEFNAEEWAAAISDAGMRYSILPTKHHDGFCMWDTRSTDYRITHPSVPYSRRPQADFFGALSAAVRAQGISVGAYFSKPDWHSDDYWWRAFPTANRNVNYDPARYPERWSRFVEYTHRQVQEIVGRYGRIDTLWLDGGWVRQSGTSARLDAELIGDAFGPNQDIDMARLAKVARQHQPGMLVVDRTVHGPYENYLTPEGGLPDHPLHSPWESCVPLGRRWYSATPDLEYKSVAEVVQLLVRAVARGGSLLLGVGPNSDGELVEPVRRTLHEVGDWLRLNGAAIYGTRATDPAEVDGVAYTVEKDGLTGYALLTDPERWSEHTRIPVPGGVRAARVLGQAETAWLPSGDHAIEIAIDPTTAPAIAIELKFQSAVPVWGTD